MTGSGTSHALNMIVQTLNPAPGSAPPPGRHRAGRLLPFASPAVRYPHAGPFRDRPFACDSARIKGMNRAIPACGAVFAIDLRHIDDRRGAADASCIGKRLDKRALPLERPAIMPVFARDGIERRQRRAPLARDGVRFCMGLSSIVDATFLVICDEEGCRTEVCRGARLRGTNLPLLPFALSLSKGCPSSLAGRNRKEGQGFDKLSPNGMGVSPCSNVIASLAAANGAPSVKAWASEQSEHRLWLSVLTFGDHDLGLAKLPPDHPDRPRYSAARDAPRSPLRRAHPIGIGQHRPPLGQAIGQYPPRHPPPATRDRNSARRESDRA